MGRVGTVKAVNSEDFNGEKLNTVVVDLGGGEVITGEHFCNSGDDALPQIGDYAIVVGVDIVGYIDYNTEFITLRGEKRIYARDADGALICSIYLQQDGTILVSNDSGSIEMSSSGVISLNEGNLEVDP